MIKFLVKLSIAVLLLYWLVQSGKLDFTLIGTSIKEHPSLWLISFLICSFNILIVSIRWKKILETKSKKNFPYLLILKLSWIGQLFNTVLPGAVSGDFVKLLYARKIDDTLSKTFLLTSVIMDRIIGLFGLLILLGVASLFKYKELVLVSPNIKNLIHLNFLIFAVMLLFLILLFIPKEIQEIFYKYCGKIPLLGRQINKTLEQFWVIGKNFVNVLSLILLSVFTQTLNILTFWVVALPYFHYISDTPKILHFTDALTFIPLGLLTIAIPITPAGIGVGHFAFNSLFHYYGISNGASLFNFYVMIAIITNLLGIFPYLLSRKEYQEVKKEMECDFRNEDLREVSKSV